ncbi:hypothetical protein V498_06727, partial [Pseudogymnoascus sp. VKM F-4517 (FW-2822)]
AKAAGPMGSWEEWARVARCRGNEAAGSGRTMASLVGQHIRKCVAPKVTSPSPRKNLLLVSAWCDVWTRKDAAPQIRRGGESACAWGGYALLGWGLAVGGYIAGASLTRISAGRDPLAVDGRIARSTV